MTLRRRRGREETDNKRTDVMKTEDADGQFEDCRPQESKKLKEGFTGKNCEK